MTDAIKIADEKKAPETDAIDKKLLNLVQGNFPVVERPYLALGEKLKISEEEILQRIKELKRKRILRQISAIFDSRRLGYDGSLVAMKVEPSRIEEAAKVVNRHPGVSHNYERNHDFNIWFTITIHKSNNLEAEVDRLHRETRALTTRILPTLKLFKIGVNFDMEGAEDPAKKEEIKGAVVRDEIPVTESDIVSIRALQKDFPVAERPFEILAGECGKTEASLLEDAQKFLKEGHMRRFGAVLFHRNSGFSANGMGVWKVPEERIETLGPKMAAFRAVSHCYQRPTYPDWPYSIFTMVHGRSREECEKVLQEISKETNLTDYACLYSTTEFKKVRVKYFLE